MTGFVYNIRKTVPLQHVLFQCQKIRQSNMVIGVERTGIMQD